jgi:hypothetical protein
VEEHTTPTPYGTPERRQRNQKAAERLQKHPNNQSRPAAGAGCSPPAVLVPSPASGAAPPGSLRPPLSAHSCRRSLPFPARVGGAFFTSALLRSARRARSRVRASAIIGCPARGAKHGKSGEMGQSAVTCGGDIWWVWCGVAWPGAPLENLFGTSALTRADGHRSFLCLWSR